MNTLLYYLLYTYITTFTEGLHIYGQTVKN